MIDRVALAAKVQKLRVRGDEMVFCCPYHADKTPSATYNVVKHLFWCFGCGTGLHGDDFLKDMGLLPGGGARHLIPLDLNDGRDVSEAIKLALNPKPETQELAFLTYSQFMKDAVSESILTGERLYGESDFISNYPAVDAYFKKRLGKNYIVPIGARFHKQMNSIIFEGENNYVEKQLAGRGRTYGRPVRCVGVDYAREKAKQIKFCCIVEGPFDWLMACQIGVPAVSMLTCHLDDGKLEDLDSIGVSEYIICVDNPDIDGAAKIALPGIAEALFKLGRKITVCANIPNRKDFGAMLFDEVKWCIKNRKPLVSIYPGAGVSYDQFIRGK